MAISSSDFAAGGGSAVCFHIAALPAKVVFQLPADGLERVSDRHVGVFMAVMRVGRAPHHQVFTRHTELDPHPEELPLMMVTVRRLHDHPAVDNPVGDALSSAKRLRMSSSRAGLGGN
jgi:hypothetical protein